jgi:hypothetical protein
MYRGYLFAILAVFACQALALAGTSQGSAKNAVSVTSVTKPPAERAVQADPVVARIRSKLAESGFVGQADPADLAALKSFYESSAAAPLWITDMGFSTRAQSALFEIEKADIGVLMLLLSSFPP